MTYMLGMIRFWLLLALMILLLSWASGTFAQGLTCTLDAQKRLICTPTEPPYVLYVTWFDPGSPPAFTRLMGGWSQEHSSLSRCEVARSVVRQTLNAAINCVPK